MVIPMVWGTIRMSAQDDFGFKESSFDVYQMIDFDHRMIDFVQRDR